MTFTALINIMPLKELLDPQGKAVHKSFKNLGLDTIQDVRIGKHITLQIEAESQAAAKQIAEEACRRLLANPVMEYFEVVKCE
jgi:phosphoribosylformylglycinamidine synthase